MDPAVRNGKMGTSGRESFSHKVMEAWLELNDTDNKRIRYSYSTWGQLIVVNFVFFPCKKEIKKISYQSDVQAWDCAVQSMTANYSL
jgi:hypothetical protein